MYVIVGLGNPGKKYELTRHNIGFIVLDNLAEQFSTSINKLKHKSLVGETRISGHKVLFVKPQTFMNLSGDAVKEIVDYYKVPLDHLIVIYDDIDIATGVLRIRKKGSAGTHNGMRSIVANLGSQDFIRCRVGIDKSPNIPLIDYVVGNFTDKEIKILEPTIEKLSSAIQTIIEDDVDIAMSKYNG